MYLFPLLSIYMGCCEDYLTCDIAFNAVMPLSRASTCGRYSHIEGVTHSHARISAVRGKLYLGFGAFSFELWLDEPLKNLLIIFLKQSEIFSNSKQK